MFHIYHCPFIFRLTVALAVILLLPGMVRPVQAAEQSPDEDKAILPSLGIRFDFDSNIYEIGRASCRERV